MENTTDKNLLAASAPAKRKRVDYKAKYFTMRGYAVILAVTLAAAVFGKLIARELEAMRNTQPQSFSVGITK